MVQGKPVEQQIVWERESEEREFRCVRFDRQRHEGAGNEDDARM